MTTNRIRELRIEAKLKQTDLANILGVRQNTLSTWETGRYEPDNEMLQRIADYFAVSVDYLLGKSPVRSFRVPDVSTLQVMQLLHVVEGMSPSQYASTYEFASNLLAGVEKKEKPAPLWGSGLSDEALEVAAAYDRAAKKDQDTVRFILADCLPRPLAAREGDGVAPTEEEMSGVTVAGEDHELP